MKTCYDLKELFDFMKLMGYTFENGIPKELKNNIRFEKLCVIEKKTKKQIKSETFMGNPPYVTIFYSNGTSKTFKLK